MSVAGLERMTIGSVAKRLTPSCHTGRQSLLTITYSFKIVVRKVNNVINTFIYRTIFVKALKKSKLLHFISLSTTFSNIFCRFQCVCYKSA